MNNKDPDIYESELNLSNTDGEEHRRKDGDRGSGQFLKLITKIPSQMDRAEARQQDLDLY